MKSNYLTFKYEQHIWAIDYINESPKNYALKDSAGQSTSASLTLWNGMNGSTVIGVADNGSALNTTMCPSTVMRYVAYTTGNCRMAVNGLNPASTYEMEFYVGRSGSGSRKTKISVNDEQKTIEAINNKFNVLKFEGIAAANGTIEFSFGIDNDTWSYMNGLVIREYEAGSSSRTTTAGIVDNLEGQEASFNLFPNPATDRLFFNGDFNTERKYNINIFSLAGNLIYKKNLENELDNGIELNFPNGVYILKVADDQGRKFQKRFVIAK